MRQSSLAFIRVVTDVVRLRAKLSRVRRIEAVFSVPIRMALMPFIFLLAVEPDRAIADDEVELTGEQCRIRLVSPWSTSPLEAHNDVHSRLLAKLIVLVAHSELSQLSAGDVVFFEQHVRAISSDCEEQHEERPRAYGTVHRATLTASCPIQAFRRLENEWVSRTRRKFWGSTSLMLLMPLILIGVVAGFIQLDRRSFGDQRWLLASVGMVLLITCGVTFFRMGQFL